MKNSKTSKSLSISLDDKIKLVTGKGNWHTNDCNGKLPSIHLADGPHGVRSQAENVADINQSCVATCFPTASAISCSWNEKAIAEMGKAIAEEAISENVSILLGPGVNIKRSPLCGRNFEYFSEDPLLAGKLASSYIKAVQSKGIGTSLKHFAGNSQETYRQTSNSQIDERALRELYLRAFEIAVKEAKPATLMASYNMLNGTYACENKELLTDILRKEWGFKGAVMSDWGACIDLALCLKAGMDLEMPDSHNLHATRLYNDLKTGKITEDEVTVAATRVLSLIEKYELKNKPLSKDGKIKLLEKNYLLAKKLEGESAVLLKNNDVLPLDSSKKSVLVIGQMAKVMRYQGGGSSHINAYKTPTVLDAFTSQGFDVQFASAYEVETADCNEALECEALALIRSELTKDANQTIVFCGGLTDLIEGEGFDRVSMSLPLNQISFIEKLRFEFPKAKVVFVAFAGAAFEIPFADEVDAILYMALGGEAVADASVDLLLGKINPSGKLSETFPLKTIDVQCSDFFAKDSYDVQYRESFFVGYRYYDTFKIPVRFPFGFGLSYTTFKYSALKVVKAKPYSVSLSVKNTGKVSGSEVVQIYVQVPESKFLRANKTLAAFTKVSLKPGEIKTISFDLDERAFSIFDTETHSFVMPSGTYKIIASSSSADSGLSKDVKIVGVDYAKDDSKTLPSFFKRNGKALNVSENEFKLLYNKEISHFDKIARGDFTRRNTLNQLKKHSLIANVLATAIPKIINKAFKSKNPNSPELRMMREMSLNGTLDCVMIQSGGRVSEKIAEIILLSANGHKFKALKRMFEK